MVRRYYEQPNGLWARVQTTSMYMGINLDLKQDEYADREDIVDYEGFIYRTSVDHLDKLLEKVTREDHYDLFDVSRLAKGHYVHFPDVYCKFCKKVITYD